MLSEDSRQQRPAATLQRHLHDAAAPRKVIGVEDGLVRSRVDRGPRRVYHAPERPVSLAGLDEVRSEQATPRWLASLDAAKEVTPESPVPLAAHGDNGREKRVGRIRAKRQAD